MREHRWLVGVGIIVAAAALSAAGDAGRPVAATVGSVALSFPDRSTAAVTLVASPLAAVKPAVYDKHTLIVGGTAIPTRGPARVEAEGDSVTVVLTVGLSEVPEAVLDLPLEAVTVRWYGRRRGGRPAVVVSGIVDVRDRTMVMVADDDLRRHFAGFDSVDVTPGLDELAVRALVRVFNPLRFDLVISRFAYRLSVGENELANAQRPGFRLRAGQTSDILIEQEVPLNDAVGAAVDLLRQRPVQLEGSMTLRTPSGERNLPVYLASGG